jgi:L-threonylcarbamoyladenylate synthase
MNKIKPDDVFIYPTDTVWGIGCSIYSETGYERISEIKQTSKNKPLSMMFVSPKEIVESFRLPEEVTLEWLENFFKLETSLGLPLSICKIKIPKWATGESEYVSIRCLENETIKKIHDDVQAPFFSTSLNVTGEAPITKRADAKKFHQEHAADCLFYDSEKDLSGTSSTIVFISESLNFEIKREGRKIEEVKKHLMNLFC